MIDVCLLGTGGMMPLQNRWLTSLLVRYNGRMILIDCGEGTQIPLKSAEWGFKAIDAILLTHYHADHVTGLTGLLLTLGNSGRREPLIIVGPPGIQKVIEGMTVIAPNLPFEIKLSEVLNSKDFQMHISGMHLSCLFVDHTLPCLSYSVEIKRQGKFDIDRAKSLDIPVNYWNSLQKGENVNYKDQVFIPSMVLGNPRKGIKVSYCTDTRPTAELSKFICQSDLFICEGMYGDDEDYNKAVSKKHMMFKEAAELAKQANVDEMWLTHFSPALVDPSQYIEAAKRIFINTYIGTDLLIKTLRFPD